MKSVIKDSIIKFPERFDSSKFQILNQENSKLLFQLLMTELQDINYKIDKELPFLSMIVKKRINAMKLPITFTDLALVGVNVFADRAGLAVLLLIDCLNYFEGKTITVRDLTDLYPSGFYTEEEAQKIIDEEIKTKKMKWSNIY